MQIKVKLVYQIFVTKPRRIQWRTEEAYLKSEAVAALPKLLQTGAKSKVTEWLGKLS